MISPPPPHELFSPSPPLPARSPPPVGVTGATMATAAMQARDTAHAPLSSTAATELREARRGSGGVYVGSGAAAGAGAGVGAGNSGSGGGTTGAGTGGGAGRDGRYRSSSGPMPYQAPSTGGNINTGPTGPNHASPYQQHGGGGYAYGQTSPGHAHAHGQGYSGSDAQAHAQGQGQGGGAMGYLESAKDGGLRAVRAGAGVVANWAGRGR